MAEVVSLQPQLVAGLRAHVTATELGEFFPRAVTAAAAAGSLITGPATAIYHADNRDNFDTTIGFPVSVAPEPVLGLVTFTLPGGEGLRATHRGNYPELSAAYRDLEAELARRGLARELSWERYLVGPSDDPDSANWVTEVVVPLPGEV